MLTSRFICALAALGALVSGAEAQNTTAPSRWGQGDEIGMANTLGSATWQRCAQSLANPRSKSYEISHLRSNTMPQSPFGVPLRDKYRPTVGIPGTVHAFNGEETVSGEPGAQGTQMDAIGHFAVLPEPWDGKGDFPPAVTAVTSSPTSNPHPTLPCRSLASRKCHRLSPPRCCSMQRRISARALR